MDRKWIDTLKQRRIDKGLEMWLEWDIMKQVGFC